MKTRGSITRDDAEALAIRALHFLIADTERVSRFLAITGIDPATIRSAAREPEFLTGVLEYLNAHEPLLTEFAADLSDPTDIGRALTALRGTPWEREVP